MGCGLRDGRTDHRAQMLLLATSVSLAAVVISPVSLAYLSGRHWPVRRFWAVAALPRRYRLCCPLTIGVADPGPSGPVGVSGCGSFGSTACRSMGSGAWLLALFTIRTCCSSACGRRCRDSTASKRWTIPQSPVTLMSFFRVIRHRLRPAITGVCIARGALYRLRSGVVTDAV